MHSTPSFIYKFPQHCLWNSPSVCRIGDGPLSSFQIQGRLSGMSSFSASLLQVVSGVMSLALGPQVVSQAQLSQACYCVFRLSRTGQHWRFLSCVLSLPLVPVEQYLLCVSVMCAAIAASPDGTVPIVCFSFVECFCGYPDGTMPTVCFSCVECFLRVPWWNSANCMFQLCGMFLQVPWWNSAHCMFQLCGMFLWVPWWNSAHCMFQLCGMFLPLDHRTVHTVCFSCMECFCL